MCIWFACIALLKLDVNVFCGHFGYKPAHAKTRKPPPKNNKMIDSISAPQIIIICFVISILFLPLIIISTKKINRKLTDLHDGLKSNGFKEYLNKQEVIRKLKGMPNFDRSFENNITDIFKKESDKYIIYHFLHCKSNSDGYSRFLRCNLIESKLNEIIPKFTIKPINLKSKLTMHLDDWKAPIIKFDNSILNSFRIRSDNKEWFLNLFELSLQEIILDNNSKIAIAYEGNDNSILGYLIENPISFDNCNQIVDGCISIIEEIITISKRKYFKLRNYD